MISVYFIFPSSLLCGGHRIPIEYCNRLCEQGYECKIIVLNCNKNFSWIDINPKVEIVCKLEIGKLAPPDWMVCTYYETFYSMVQWRTTTWPKAKMGYLVQQLEDRFSAEPHYQERAKETYRRSKKIGVTCIAVSRWLVTALKEKYDMDAVYVPNRQELPEDLGAPVESSSGKPIVLIEGNAQSKQKGVGDGWDALQHFRAEAEIWLLTNSFERQVSFPFNRIFSRVPWKEALNVIRSADILVKPTYFEGSPTPVMEAMELSTAIIITDATGTSEYCIDQVNSLVYPIGNKTALGLRIKTLLDLPDYRKWLVENGKATARNKFTGWQPSIDILKNTFA